MSYDCFQKRWNAKVSISAQSRSYVVANCLPVPRIFNECHDAVKPLGNIYNMFPSPGLEIPAVHAGLQRRAVKFQ